MQSALALLQWYALWPGGKIMTKTLRAPAPSLFLLSLVLLAVPARAARKFKEKTPTVPLTQVIAATESALNDYQTYAHSPEGIKDGIPPLATADFDFKTVVDNKGGFSINLFIITLGASYDKQQTNDLDFQYMPHVQPKLEERLFSFDGGTAPKTLYQEIVDTLKESAKEIRNANDQPPGPTQLDLCQLTLALSFGVTTDVQGGIKAPIQIVTISATLDHSKNNVQQVKLTFKVKDPKNLSCVAAKP
jgi:hypothetical protein